MNDVPQTLLDGLKNAALMAYEVWWALVPDRVGEVVPAELLGTVQVQDQEGDRDREDAVAEGDDARELDPVLLAAPAKLAPIRLLPLCFDAAMIGEADDGTPGSGRERVRVANS